MTAAKKAVTAGMAPITMAPLSPIETSSMAGKTFVVISLTNQSALNVAQAAGVSSALATVGAKTVVLDGRGTADVIAQDFASAISLKAAGIVTLGLDPTLVPSAVANAKAAGIPVVIGTANAPDAPHLPGVVANVAVNSTLEGELQADYALAATNCQLHAAVYFTSAGPVTVNHANGAASEIKKLCGAACSLEKVDVSAATFATTLTGQVQTTLQRSPDINFLLSTADLFVSYIMQGRNAVNKDVPIAGAQGDTLSQAIAGHAQVVDIQWLPGAVTGWYLADTVMRGVLGKAQNVTLPLRLVDATNWGTSVSFQAQYPEIVNYQSAFEKAWGVTK